MGEQDSSLASARQLRPRDAGLERNCATDTSEGGGAPNRRDWYATFPSAHADGDAEGSVGLGRLTPLTDRCGEKNACHARGGSEANAALRVAMRPVVECSSTP